MRTGLQGLGTRVPRAYRALLVAALVAALAIPLVGITLAVDAARAIGIGPYDFVFFISAITVLGGTSVVVGVIILWRKPGNKIGLVMAVGGLLLMSVFTAWLIAIVRGAAGDVIVAALFNWWGTAVLLPAIALLFPTVGILFPDERLPGPAWRKPIAVCVIAIGIGTLLQTIAPWRLEGGFNLQNPLAIDGVPVELSEVGGGVAALGTFLLFGIAAAAVLARFRRSSGIERAQQKWLVASVIAMAIAFPMSFATTFGPDYLIDLLSVLTGALVPIAVGIAILRYHLFKIDRIVSRTIAYVVITTLLVAAYAASIVLLQGPLGTLTAGDTLAVALSTLAVAALFQPVRLRVQAMVDRRFDRARYDADRTSAAFADRLREEVDIDTVTTDLRATVHDSFRPTSVRLWLREAGR